jgi:hypothetical protein
MRRTAPFLALALVACAHGAGGRRPATLMQIGWSGPPPHVGLQLAGSEAGDHQAACEAAAAHAGIVVDGNASVQAILLLEPGDQRVQLLSQRRGALPSEKRGSVPLEQLCAEAAVAAAELSRDENSGSPMDSQSSFAVSPDPEALPTARHMSHGDGGDLHSGDPARGPIQ